MRLVYNASIDFYTRPNPGYHLMTSFLVDMLSSGHHVHLIGCEDITVAMHIPDELLGFQSFSYELVPLRPVKKSAFVMRYLSGLFTDFRKIGPLMRTRDCDLVFIQSSPTALFTILVSKLILRKAPVIYNIQDMFPGSSISSGVMTKRWMQKVFFRMQKIAYAKSDVITVISEDMKAKVVEQGVEAEKVQVIVNWYDDKTVREIPWESNRFVEKHQMRKDKFYVQYAGTMGFVFDYKMVLEVAERLRSNHDIVFQMIGMGSQRDAFIEEAKSRNLSNIEFLPLEKQEMVSDVYSACSVCLIPLKRGVIGNSVPSKAGLLMACRRCIVTSVDEDSIYFDEMNRLKIGVAVSNLDPDGVAAAIRDLYANPEKRLAFANAGFHYGHERYSRKTNTAKYIALMEEMASR